jgi:glycosyltransferase involved in cell wall biosynthesis
MTTASEQANAGEAASGQADRSFWPRIALVTPVRNSAKYIEQTIQSVIAQNYPNLEYFIVDGASTDGTLDIIRRYQSQISGWLSEPDNGMYDALNKGFSRTSGEIMGWISATDLLHPGAFAVVAAVFQQFPEVEWITGRPTHINEQGQTYNVDPVPRWSRLRFLAGFNRYVQQESTFWRRSLWQKAGARVDDSLRMAGDFELWLRFFRHARLYPVDALIGGFRMHGASLGLQQAEECNRIHDQIIQAELKRIPQGPLLKSFLALNAAMKKVPFLRYAWWRLIEQPLYSWPGPDRPPVIRFESGQWRY